MKEPLDSLDPVDWLVWADWEEDRGGDGSRSRAIAGGLEKYPEGLYLVIPWTGGTLQAACSCGDSDDGNCEDWACCGPYLWSEVPAEREPYGGSKPIRISPLSKPKSLSHDPKLIPAFWDKLAEIGTREDSHA